MGIKTHLKNRRASTDNKQKYKFGVKVPRTAKEAIALDRENGKTLWKDAMKKEIDSNMSYKVFQIQMKGHMFEEIWQYAPLHWVFCVKHDLRHKARLVMGGHVTDATGYDKYEATIKMENLR